MKLERFSKYKKRNRIVACSVIGILLIVGSITLLRTFAFYESKKEFNVLKGQIPSHWYDMDVLSVVVDGKEQSEIPTRGLYKVEADCGSTKGEWDYNAWTLNLANITENTRCNVTFTSNALSDAEYQEYIEAGISLRRNTYRGKDITKYYNDGSLYTMISNGTFDDVYVGDYIRTTYTDGMEYVWLVADIDNYLYNRVSEHHATIISAKPLMYIGMNATDTAEGGYVHSRMAKETLASLVATGGIIGKPFENHLITYTSLLTNEIDSKRISAGDGTNSGSSSGAGWVYRNVDLMSEVNVFGIRVYSGNGIDTGSDFMQYAIFRLKPSVINHYQNTSFNYWLKDVATAEAFGVVGSGDFAPANCSMASRDFGVRPRFLIG